MQILGFDIGGANIKACDADGNALSLPFAMWTKHEQLPETLRKLANDVCAVPDLVAATMTAELADCFPAKADGVEFVITALERAFPGIPLRIWLTSGEFAEPADARDFPTLVAAANWHALATWAGRAVPDGPALLIDVGSTTTDIIPLLDGFPASQGLNDLERLLCGELVYTGAFRTPICAVVSSVPVRNQWCPIAAEIFATMADALLLAELRDEDLTRTDTADGRPLSRQLALNRLARMVCCDRTELTEEELTQIAIHVVEQQSHQLCSAAIQVLKALDETMQQTEQRSLEIEKPVVILSGSGAVVAQKLVAWIGDSKFSSQMFLPDMFCKPVPEAACAFAIARLAHDRCRDDLLEISEF